MNNPRDGYRWFFVALGLFLGCNDATEIVIADAGTVDARPGIVDSGRDGPPSASSKYQLWLQKSYFRGFDVAYFNSQSESQKSLADFQALKDSGATVAQIQCVEGTRQSSAPYGPNADGIEALEKMVGWCRQVGLAYIIAVREGPGRQSVDEEATDPIWKDKGIQAEYARMLREDIVAKYGDDPLMVAINVMVEPNPFNVEISNGTIDTPAELASTMSGAGIDTNAMMSLFITEIRKANTTLPIIVQGPAWSGPRYFSLLSKQADPYVIYDVHSYEPFSYTHPDCGGPNCGGLVYPGVLDGEAFDKKYLEEEVLAPVVKFQATHGVPILLGEFGLQFAQAGGVDFLDHYQEIAIKNGWHFCLWAYRPETQNATFVDFDAEKWKAGYWQEVLSWFP
jgi:hypothetical protein